MECVPTWVLSNHAWLNLTSLLHTQINKTLFEMLFWTWILLIYCLSDQKWDWKSLEFLHISQRDEAEQPDILRQHVSCVLHQGESILPDVSQFLLFHMLIWCCWHVITTYFNLCREHQWSWHPFLCGPPKNVVRAILSQCLLGAFTPVLNCTTNCPLAPKMLANARYKEGHRASPWCPNGRGYHL